MKTKSIISSPLVFNKNAPQLVENFLISAVSTILIVRTYLKITNYPQLGGGNLHIAHMLWGGLLMLVTIQLMLIFIDRRVRLLSSILGGIGFGLFIDELGKFITTDNNYFYEPTIALMYVLFVILFIVYREVNTKIEHSENEYSSEYATTEGDINSLDQKIKERLARIDQKIIKSKDFSNFIIGTMLISSLAHVILAATLIFKRVYSGTRLYASVDFEQIGQFLSSFVAGLLVFAGVYFYKRKPQRCYKFFIYAILIQIFLTQFFLFWEDQLLAIGILVINLSLYQVVKYKSKSLSYH